MNIHENDSWNDVLFTLNFDLDLNRPFPKITKDLNFFNIMPLMGTTSYSAYLIESLQLN